jgi:hypothetical protein
MMERWRGLKALVVDAVEHGSRAVERIQKETAKVPFDILEQVPPLAAPAKGIHIVYDTTVSGVHGIIRLCARATGEVLDVVIDTVERRQQEDAQAEASQAQASQPEASQPEASQPEAAEASAAEPAPEAHTEPPAPRDP